MRVVILLSAALAPACIDYDLDGKGGDNPPAEEDSGPTDIDTQWGWDGECEPWDFDPTEVGITDSCAPTGEGSFNPIIEWNLGAGKFSWSNVAVGDIDLDGMPEIVANLNSSFLQPLTYDPGVLVVARGDGSGTLWEREATLAWASHPAIGDIDGDGWPEIVVAREYATSFLAVGDYTIAAYDGAGNEVWESEHFVGDDFDYATAVNISDMDHDGSPEIIAGRVILNADGTTRGVGQYGRGCYGSTDLGGEFTIDESTASAVADLDLDGVEEVVTGNAIYDPDGNAKWYDPSQQDGMVAIANLDSDAEGEYVLVTGNTVRGMDTHGVKLWGPVTLATANILSPPSVADLDQDGSPEIMVAGGNYLVVLHADGSEMWRAHVTDETGASGASIFDFEGDGWPEVVYISEVEMAAYDGVTGAQKFYSRDHASNTMFDYPVIADVDGDSHAEIVVAHAGWDAAVSVYGDLKDSWAPARQVWNQHGYSITNINDDLSVPTTATQNFTLYNSWHSAYDREGSEALEGDLESEILGICADDCDMGVLLVAGRVRNRAPDPLPAGLPVALYAMIDGVRTLADVQYTPSETPSAMSSEEMNFIVPIELAVAAEALVLVADDDGTGASSIAECDEVNNDVRETGAWCQE